jgi:ligand-binding SRPBCC domain-containing protein
MITFKTHSGIFTLEVRQFVKTSITEAWDFFSSPANLSKITPPHMGFKITSGEPAKMYPGQIISHVKHQSFFVDEQRFGPYSMWHHEHHFEVQDDAVLMTDRVSYKLPLGFLGRIAHAIFVGKQLKQIFDYREKCLNQVFGLKPENK